jgi:DNA-binding NtrC family response regulator
MSRDDANTSEPSERSLVFRDEAPRCRVLVFDDEEGIRKMLLRILSGRGCEVIAYPSARGCTRCICGPGERCADVLLSDVSMPPVNGLDFVENQRSVGCRFAEIGLMSGSWTPTGQKRAQRLGCRVFPKPLDLDEVCGWVESCTERVGARRLIALPLPSGQGEAARIE